MGPPVVKKPPHAPNTIKRYARNRTNQASVRPKGSEEVVEIIDLDLNLPLEPSAMTQAASFECSLQHISQLSFDVEDVDFLATSSNSPPTRLCRIWRSGQGNIFWSLIPWFGSWSCWTIHLSISDEHIYAANPHVTYIRNAGPILTWSLRWIR